MSTQIIHRHIDSAPVAQRGDDGYINATALCKACGKLFADYRRQATTKAFLRALSTDMGNPISELVRIIKGFGVQQGTWVHPQVAIHLGQWASPKFAVQVSKWVFEWMQGKTASINTASGTGEMLGQYRLISQTIAELEDQRQALRASIYGALNGAHTMTDASGRVVVRIQERTTTAWRTVAKRLNAPQELIDSCSKTTRTLHIYARPQNLILVH